jgi:hypothetical protein
VYKLSLLSVLLFSSLSSASASQLTPNEEITVCKMGFSAVNYNSINNYKYLKKNGETILLRSSKYSNYKCEIFSGGKIITLSTPSWGRIKPTGNITKNGDCLIVKLFDPGLGVNHKLNSCN